MKSKILFIDDEQEILDAYKSIFIKKENEVLNDLLKDLNIEELNTSEKDEIEYVVDLASQGMEGFEKVKKAQESKDPYQIVFIDMRMPPGIGGSETAKLIRSIDDNIEIVFVTAYSDVNMTKIVSEVGTPDKILYLKKPFDIQEVKQFSINLTHKYFNTRVKDRFLSNVTHELKTPLASILGFSQLIEDEYDLTEIQDYNSVIYKNADLMRTLIDDLIGSVSPHSQKKPLKEWIQILPILEHVHSMTSMQATEKGLTFQIEATESASIWGDKNKITQCLVNLVNNAIKFTNEGFIKIKTSTKNKDLTIDIIDSGVGIEKDHHGIIFNRFVRLEDEHHNVPGFGLGLSIVKEILDDHNAQIDIDSKLGAGTKFSLTFTGGDEI